MTYILNNYELMVFMNYLNHQIRFINHLIILFKTRWKITANFKFQRHIFLFGFFIFLLLAINYLLFFVGTPFVSFPHGVTEGLPPLVLPPCGWSTGFILTQLILGQHDLLTFLIKIYFVFIIGNSGFKNWFISSSSSSDNSDHSSCFSNNSFSCAGWKS